MSLLSPYRPAQIYCEGVSGEALLRAWLDPPQEGAATVRLRVPPQRMLLCSVFGRAGR